MSRQLFQTILLGLLLGSQRANPACAQEPHPAPDANHLPRVIIELTEIDTRLVHLDELYATKNGEEFDAKLAQLVASQALTVNRTYRLTSTSGQAVSMVFGKRVPVVTSTAKTAIGNTESTQLENYGTTIEAIATLQGDTVALELKYESSRQELDTTPLPEGAPPRRPRVETAQFRTVIPIRLNEPTLVVGAGNDKEQSLIARVKSVPVFIDTTAAHVPYAYQGDATSAGGDAPQRPDEFSRTGGAVNSSNERTTSRTSRQNASDSGEASTTRVLELSNVQDAERRDRIAREIVRRLDRNGDGVVGADEFRGTRDRFDELDRDRNGSIEATELIP